MDVIEHHLDPRLLGLCQDGRRLAETLERGTADMPLTNHFDRLMTALDDGGLTIVVLPLTAEACTRTLRWLSAGKGVDLGGRDLSEVSVIEVSVGRLAGVGGNAAPLHCPGLLSVDLPLGSLAVAAPVTIRLILDPAAVAERHELYGVTVAGAHLVLVAATLSSVFHAEARRFVGDLCLAAPAVCPLVLEDGPDDPPAPETWVPWWEDRSLLPGRIVAPIGLPRAADPPLPAFLTDPASGVRRAMVQAVRAEEIHLSAELVQQQHGQRVRRLQARHKHEARALRRLEDSARLFTIKNRLDVLRNDLQDSIGSLVDEIEESGKRHLLPNGALSRQVEEIVETISPEDLEQQNTPIGIQLSLRDRCSRSIESALRTSLQTHFRDDVVILRRKLEEQQRSAEEQLGDILGTPTALSLRLPDDKPIWNILGSMVKVDVRYRGEMQKRGFLKRFNSARSAVLFVMLSVSLVGGFAGFNPRGAPLFGLLLFFIFVGAFIYSYRSWKREDEVRLAKEIARVKETMAVELRRLVSEIQREKLSRLGGHLDDVRREVARRIDTIVKELGESRARQVERDRRECQTRIRGVEAMIREMEGLGQPLGQLLRTARELRDGSAAALAKTLHGG